MASCSVTSRRHNYQIVSMAWAPDAGILDQPRLAVAGDARNIVIWSPFLRVPVRALRDHTRIVKSIDFSADCRLFASKSDDGTVRVWRCDTWQTVGVLEEPGSPLWPPNLAFHPQLQQPWQHLGSSTGLSEYGISLCRTVIETGADIGLCRIRFVITTSLLAISLRKINPVGQIDF